MTEEWCDVTGCDRAPEAGALCLFHADEYWREEQARHEEYWRD